MAKQPKLKTLLEDIFQEQPQVNKFEVVEGVKSFNIVGKSLYNNSNIMEVAKQLSHIAEQAHTHVMSETTDWFDKVSVSKNMKSLKGSVVEFKKTAMEANQLNQRLTGLYEDIGHVLNRYYEIDEADKGDMDNDGKNEPDSEEYLEHGLYPGDRNMVHLSSTRLNALEAGRHIIGKPIVLLVDVKTAEEKGSEIMKAGTTVYLSKEISGDFLKKLPDST